MFAQELKRLALVSRSVYASFFVVHLVQARATHIIAPDRLAEYALPPVRAGCLISQFEDNTIIYKGRRTGPAILAVVLEPELALHQATDKVPRRIFFDIGEVLDPSDWASSCLDSKPT
ncbi:hypothetical protein F4779DRAFT_618006 [Xylariaceae sp. FL0662B]|nr:hypothetical protein F4779DRAFT_618006 [Xylariaceae sp. FL0662B]